MIAFHCTKRAGGTSVAPPDFVYGPNQRDHSRPGSSVFPERAKNSSRGSADASDDLAAPAGGGLHHAMPPQCENSCASLEPESNVRVASYSGPAESPVLGSARAGTILPG